MSWYAIKKTKKQNNAIRTNHIKVRIDKTHQNSNCRLCGENDPLKPLWYFDIQTDPVISARRPDLIIINNKRRTCRIVNFAVLADHRVKLKENEKKDKYPDLARELKKLWNIKVTVIPFVIGGFGTVTKGLLKGLKDLEIRGRVETIQSTTLLRTARILRRVMENWQDFLLHKLQWKTLSECWCEKFSLLLLLNNNNNNNDNNNNNNNNSLVENLSKE